MAQRLRMDIPVPPIPKHVTREIPPCPSFLLAEIERNSVGELNAIERNLAAKETHDR